MENVSTVFPVCVYIRLSVGPGTHPMVHNHRAGAHQILRSRTIRHSVLLLVPVVPHHEVIQDTCGEEPSVAVVFVCYVFRRRVRVHTVLRARN